MNEKEYRQHLETLGPTHSSSTSDSTPTKTQQDSYLLRNGILFKKLRDTFKRVPRRTEVEVILKTCHDDPTSGHFKINATLGRVKKQFWWPQMDRDIRQYVGTCDVCQRRDPPIRSQVLNPIPVTAPFDRWGIDIVHLPRTDNSNRYAVVAVDYFTKWPEARALPNIRAETVAQFIFDDIICRHGCPFIIQSDNGSSFKNALVTPLLKRYNIKHVFCSPYHPQANGLVERLNQTIARALAKLAQENVRTWDKYLAGVLCAYRTTKQSSTKFEPFYLTHGRPARMPIDIPGHDEQPSTPETVEQRVWNILTRFDPARVTAAQNITRAQERQKQRYDVTVQPRPFDIGEKVLLRRSKLQNRHDAKLEPYWDGPYYIHNTFQNGTYRLRKLTGELLRAPAHGDRLKLYKQRLPELLELPELPIVLVETPVPKEDSEPVQQDDVPKLDSSRPLRRSPRRPLAK